MIRIRVQTKDSRKAWDEFRGRMAKVHGSHVTVGVHEDAGSYSGADAPTVAEVALWNEFGTRTIPERSYLRAAVDKNMALINQWRAELVEDVKLGRKDVATALEALGFRVRVLVQNEILSGVAPVNAPSTLAQKREEGVGSTTLQWSRLLLRSIGTRVHLK